MNDASRDMPARRPSCTHCMRPLKHCLCALIPSLDSNTRILILQHPAESRHALNTARFAALGLRNASLYTGLQFDEALWTDEAYRPALLFPGTDAQVLTCHLPAAHNHNEASDHANTRDRCIRPVERPVLLVVLDGTWRQARQLLAAHPGLATLPRMTLPDGMTTQYRVRHADDPRALSTIEAIAAALDVLDAPGSFRALLKPFEVLVARQIAAMGQERYQQHHVLRTGSRAQKQKAL